MQNRRVWLALFIILVTGVLAFQNCAHQYNNGGAVGAASISQADPSTYYPKEILVRVNSPAVNDEFRAWAYSLGLNLQDDWTALNLTHWTWTQPMSVTDVQGYIAEQPFAGNVLYAEPNFKLQTIPSTSTIQSLTLAQVQPTLIAGADNQTSVNIGSPTLWTTVAAAPVKPIVAVIDSGLDLTHQVFTSTGAIWVNKGEIAANGIDDDKNGYIDDINGWDFANNKATPTDDVGHGTHCAGIVLGVGLDIFAGSGKYAQSKIAIMPLKFIGADGTGKTSDAINAIAYAIQNGASVMSNSWGGSEYSNALQDIMASAYDARMFFVAAAGNAAADNDVTPFYPANYKLPNVMTVAASTSTDTLASFSNYGKVTVDMASPGVSILSTYPVNQFAYLSGTSMATPFVAGTAALMKAVSPNMSGYQIKQIILSQAVTVGGLTPNLIQPVRLDSLAAVTQASTATVITDQPVYALATNGNDSTTSAGGCGLVVAAKNLPPPSGGSGLMMALLLAPLFLLMALRNQRLMKPQPVRSRSRR